MSYKIQGDKLSQDIDKNAQHHKQVIGHMQGLKESEMSNIGGSSNVGGNLSGHTATHHGGGSEVQDVFNKKNIEHPEKFHDVSREVQPGKAGGFNDNLTAKDPDELKTHDKSLGLTADDYAGNLNKQ